MIGPPPMCVSCKRANNSGTCEAYPDGIPEEIIMNDWDHRVPQPGDHGLQFVLKEGAQVQDWWPVEEGGEG